VRGCPIELREQSVFSR